MNADKGELNNEGSKREKEIIQDSTRLANKKLKSKFPNYTNKK
jgi:hypothetical protein